MDNIYTFMPKWRMINYFYTLRIEPPITMEIFHTNIVQS